ncbi:MAG: TOMM precursor leader peptide-binding protein, partial [Algicola sp.]|nr:TOMM precursor leader peptide-binding protein [Algicola sp.]
MSPFFSMLTPLNINKNIAISQLSNLNLIVSTPLQTMVIEQPQMQAIILQLLETPLDMMQLIDKLADKYPQMELMRTLNTLKHYQIINAAQQPPAFELHNHFSAMAAHNASDMPFKFIDFEQNSLVAHFESNGHGPAAAGFPVMLVNDILDQRLDAFQQTQFSAEQPFIVAQVTGTELLISPVIDPCKSPCWACMAYRLKLHRPMQALLQSAKQIQTAQADFCAQAVNVIRKVLSAQIEPLHRSDDSSNQSSDEQSHDLVKLNLTNGETSHHRVSRRPQCPCCGDPDQKVDYHKLSLLADNSTVANDAGGYRTVSAKLTYQKYQHLVDPLTGIMASVDEYRKVPGAPIYNYCSGRNIALQSRSLFWLNNHMRSSSGGKGANEQQAKTGALCESVERYSMVYHGQEACTTASYSELASKAIHPNTCMNFSHKQITERESINKHSSAFHTLVPIDFDENAQLDWTGTYSLIDQQIRYLPSAFCFAQYPAADENQLLAYPDSNGCAAGNNPAEAILQGT